MNRAIDYSNDPVFNMPRIEDELLEYFDIVHSDSRYVTCGDAIYPIRHFPNRFKDGDLSLVLDMAGFVCSAAVRSQLSHCLSGYSYSAAYGDIDWYEHHTVPRLKFDSRAEIDTYFGQLGTPYQIVVNDGETLYVAAGQKLGTIVYAPANRFGGVESLALQRYAYVQYREADDVYEVHAETNLIAVLDHPELIVRCAE